MLHYSILVVCVMSKCCYIAHIHACVHSVVCKNPDHVLLKFKDLSRCYSKPSANELLVIFLPANASSFRDCYAPPPASFLGASPAIRAELR
jgi:hypothetical protein